jgi:hypothetical protein
MKTTDETEAFARITVDGEPVAECAAPDETEDPTRDPGFVALIERSRIRQRREGGIPAAEMRRRLGL